MSDDDTFVAITNRKIYDAVQSLESRLVSVEFRLDVAARRASMILPTVSAVAAVLGTLLATRH